MRDPESLLLRREENLARAREAEEQEEFSRETAPPRETKSALRDREEWMKCAAVAGRVEVFEGFAVYRGG